MLEVVEGFVASLTFFRAAIASGLVTVTVHLLANFLRSLHARTHGLTGVLVLAHSPLVGQKLEGQ